MAQQTIVCIVVIILALGAGTYFVWQNQVLSAQLSKATEQVTELKEAKAKTETELAIFKNTDLGKEVQILQLKLEAKEKERVEIQNNFTTTNTTLTTLRNNLKLIPNVTRALSIMSGTFGKQPPECFNAADRAAINRELSIVGDSMWQEKWNGFIANTDSKNCSMSPQQFFTAIDYGLEKIVSFMRQ